MLVAAWCVSLIVSPAAGRAQPSPGTVSGSCDPARFDANAAREHVVSGVDATTAFAEWRRTLDGGGAIAWTATLHDVDPRFFFVLAFDRAGIRIYRLEQLAGPTRTRMRVQVMPDGSFELSRALAGCLPELDRPEAVIPWSAVRELKAGNWVIWFGLDGPVTIQSDGGKEKTSSDLKVNLHGATGGVEYRWNWDPWRGVTNLRGIGIGPAAFQQRVRATLVEIFDLAGRVRLPAQKRGAGW
jgi:hypothetical protein